MKRIKWLLFISGVIACIGCAKKELTLEQATEIINEFNKGNYRYIETYYVLNPDGKEEIIDERKGIKVENPYRQYDITTIEKGGREYENYWFEDDGKIKHYGTIALTDTDRTEWVGGEAEEKKYVKGTSYYDQEGLIFAYNCEEDGQAVFTTSYKRMQPLNASLLGLSQDSTEQIDYEYTCDVEYYINMKNKRVEKVVVLFKEHGRISEISNQIRDGMNFEEAEKVVDESCEYSYPVIEFEIIYDNLDMEIEIPEELINM